MSIVEGLVGGTFLVLIVLAIVRGVYFVLFGQRGEVNRGEPVADVHTELIMEGLIMMFPWVLLLDAWFPDKHDESK